MKKFLSVIIVFLTLLACTGAPQQPEKATLEIRLAASEPGEGLTGAIFEPTGETFYLHPEVMLTNADIAAASVSQWEDRPVVDLTLTETGKEKFAEFTRANIGKRAAILVDGKLVAAPIIKAPILQGRALINGIFSEEEAKRIAEGLMME
jgi:preprotein translocase subunit SecD